MKTSIRILVLVFALITLLSFTACDGEDNVGDGDKPTDDPSGDVEQSLTLNKAEISIAVGNSETLTVTALPEGCEGKQLTWSSSDPSIVMVNAEGKVSALDIGSATVTVKVNGTNHEASCSVTVTPIYVSSITVNKTELSLAAGQSEKLAVNVMPINASNRSVKWESSDPTVATVSAGTVTAHKNGTAVITAKAADGSGVSATCTLTVKSVSVAGVTLNKNTMQIDKGDKVKLLATVLPANAENKLVTWSSSNPSVISVDEFGNVKALKPGSATITANASGKKAYCTVSAVEAKMTYTSYVDASVVALDATGTPKDGADTLYWQANERKRVELGSKKDFSSYDALKFRVYSQNKTNSTVQIRFSYADNDKQGTTMAPYYRAVITVDFTGWKEFELPIYEMLGNYSPTWTRISYISFDCSGWNLTPNADTKLYFDDLEFVKYGYNISIVGTKNEAQHLASARQNWKNQIIGSVEPAAQSPEYKARIIQAQTNAINSYSGYTASYKNTFVGTGTDKAGTLFKKNPDKTYGQEALIGDIYNHIQRMAIGYATPGTSCYKSKDMLQAIKNSLDYAYNNYYGDKHLTDASFQQWVKQTNWWWWEIGIPSYVVDILMILGDDLTQAEKDKYLTPVNYFVPRITMTACNRLWVGKVFVGSALLQNRSVDALKGISDLDEIFDYVTTSDGFYEDGSFVQHNKHAYTGGYGISLLDELTQFMMILHGTVYDFGDESNVVYSWLYDTFEPIMAKSNVMSCVRGREVVRNSEYSKFVTLVACFAEVASISDEEDKDRLEGILKYFLINNDDTLLGDIPLDILDYVKKLETDPTVEARDDYEIFKVFGNMDRTVQHRPDYSVALSLSSTRIFKYEAINKENMKGWYQGDGMIYIYTDGYDYNAAFFNNANQYKMPGTTVSAATRNEDNMNSGSAPALGFLGNNAFSGGVSNGKYGVTAMILGYEENPYFNTDITAKKSYFLFDNEIICIGSGIAESTLGDNVYTTVENRLWKTSDVFTVDGVRKTGDGSAVAEYMYFSGMGGYVFDGETTVDYGKHVNSESYLEITVSHGANPTDGKYFFIYLPTATEVETKAYSDSLSERITVISDSGSVHAVKDNDIGVTGYVFYEAGSCNGVTVSAPCVVMIDADGKVTVSDPTHTLSTITVTVNGSSLSFNVSGNVGQSFTKSLD